MRRREKVAGTTVDRPARIPHPVHISLAASMIPLFLGAVLSDLAYGSSYQVQWKNFASWLIVGGLIFAGLTLVWSLVEALRADNRAAAKRWIGPILVLATFVAGFINALVHAKDAWASVPAGTILSVITLLLALAAVWSLFANRQVRP
jgi:uncharacterized membrane protein